jgi:hypothetical protein
MSQTGIEMRAGASSVPVMAIRPVSPCMTRSYAFFSA